MKGLVFTEFLDFVEMAAGEEILDDMIGMANVPSGAAYTSVGLYDYQEMVALVSALSQITGEPVARLVQMFGKHLLGRFSETRPQFFENVSDVYSFIESVEAHIHVEVLKLYPDAQLPSIKADRIGQDVLRVRYVSCRPFGDLCVGLIEGCGQHFGETLEITQTVVADGLEIEVRRRTADAA